MKKLVIDRSRWLRGVGGESKLFEPKSGKMCCLGFEAKSRGVSDDAIALLDFPSEIRGNQCPVWLLEKRLGLAGFELRDNESILALFNDRVDIDDATREAWLTEGFRALAGIEVTFIDGPVKP